MLIVVGAILLCSCSKYTSTVPVVTTIVGDLIDFGGSQWRVLDIRSGQALVVSERVLDYRQYHTSYTSITWADCSLRSHLNGAYLTNNFTQAERARIVQKTVINSNNPLYGTSGGANTKDYVFLLSIDEVLNYLYVPGMPKSVIGSNYWINDHNNSARVALYDSSNATMWWLRSPGGISLIASYVNNNGSLYIGGEGVNLINLRAGVRPALWLNL
jgi:hypothetical protein